MLLLSVRSRRLHLLHGTQRRFERTSAGSSMAREVAHHLVYPVLPYPLDEGAIA